MGGMIKRKRTPPSSASTSHAKTSSANTGMGMVTMWTRQPPRPCKFRPHWGSSFIPSRNFLPAEGIDLGSKPALGAPHDGPSPPSLFPTRPPSSSATAAAADKMVVAVDQHAQIYGHLFLVSQNNDLNCLVPGYKSRG